MQEYTTRIREVAGRLLSSGEVEAFIGYRRGTVPMLNRPVLIRDAGSVETLWWDSHCGLNLCRYVRGIKGRVAVLATGCNSRNLVTHIIENQVRREQLYVVGVSCRGMVDHRAVGRAVDGREIQEVSEEGETLRVAGPGFEERLERQTLIQGNCRECRHPNPVFYDELVGEPVEVPERTELYRDVERVEGMEPEARWGFFERLVSHCIRCYACREACPLCYCPVCFVDESRPQWLGKSVDPTDTLTFHLLRAYHCAGRCTDCGACERVCPVGISVRQFTRKLNRDAERLFGWEAGLTLEERPPLDVYRPEDYDGFIK